MYFAFYLKDLHEITFGGQCEKNLHTTFFLKLLLCGTIQRVINGKGTFPVQRFSLAEGFRRNVKLLTGVIGQVTHPKINVAKQWEFNYLNVTEAVLS